MRFLPVYRLLTKKSAFVIIFIEELIVMKENYQKQLDLIIEGLSKEKRPTLLLHSCCGPCSSYVMEYLSAYFDITVYYYNPNIFPEEEYQKRLENQKKVIEKSGWASLTDSRYDHGEFLAAVKGLESEKEGGKRCAECFRLRLEQTAKAAKEGGFNYFTTTLSVSPHKDAQILGKLGEQIGEAVGVKHLPADFKKREGYKRSIELSKKFELYRQEYCGCEFSKRGSNTDV